MASATLDHFPPDTKVDVWTKTGDSFDGGGAGKRVEKEVQVGTDGSLVLVGLKDNQEYWACGDTGRVVAFIAPDPDPKTGRREGGKKKGSGRKVKPKGRAAQPTAGEGRRAASTGGPDKVKRPSGGAKPISATQQGGSGRSTSRDDEKLTGRPGKATQRPTRRTGAKGVRGARGTGNSR